MAKEKILGKVSTTVEAFLAALKNTVTDQKGAIPILSMARVQGTTIIGTDLDVFTIVPFKGKGKGDFVVPYKQVMQILMGEKGPLAIEYVEIAEDRGNKPTEIVRKIRMNIGVINFSFDTMPIANFPQLRTPSDQTLTIQGDVLARMIARTSFSISHEESRYTLNGTLLKAENGTVIAAATDGHRLSFVSEAGEGEIKPTLLLRSATAWVSKNCGGDVRIGFADGYQTIVTETGTMIARMLSGQFPNYEAVMPRDNKVTATFASPKEFDGILKRVAKCSDERSGAVKFTVRSGTVALSASSGERGSSRAEIKCDTHGINGDKELAIGFNFTFITDFLKAINGEKFTVALKEPDSSALLSVPNFSYIVMPMRM